MLRLPVTAALSLLLVFPPLQLAAAPASLDPDPIRVSLDCQTFGCDRDFFRTELTWVDWVFDRQDADVHVIVTAQGTGGGGRLYDISFQGRRAFQGEEFTLTHASAADATDDDRRRGILRTLGFGLVRFASETTVADRLQVRFQPQAAEPGPPGAAGQPPATAEQDDPWNFWVFTTSANMSANGESQSSFQRYSGSVTATRTTEDWKVRYSVSGNYNENRFRFPDRTVKSITRSYTGTGLVVRSLNDRWSTGVRVRARNSTFQNYDLALEVGPAAEFSFFPYSESTRRALTLEYGAAVHHYDYTEETLYDRFQETLPEHSLRLSLNLRQAWGSANVSLQGSQFLHDTSRNSASLLAGLNLRLFRGLSLNLNGFYSRIANQLNVAKRDATEEEVFLRRRQLETNFSYFTSVGITYRFGSIFSSIVNPRMDASGGGPVFMMF